MFLEKMPAQKQSKAPAKKTTSTKKTTTTKKSAPVKETVVATPEPVAAAPQQNEVVTATTEVAPFSEVLQSMATYQANLQATISAVSSSLAQLKAEYRALEKKVQREARVTTKQLAKRRKKNGARQPSGFVKPTRISDELAAFLGKEKGTEMARTSVTKEINTYIKAHNLKDANNGRIIHPDTKLSKLLKVTSADEVTYFNLQKYMSHHFHKATPSAQA